MRHWNHKASKAVHGWDLGPLDYLLAAPGMLFGGYGMPVSVLALGLWLGLPFGAVMVMTALTTLAITAPLKRYFNRERPEPPEPRRLKLRRLVNNPSFPSGDSAQAAGVVVLLMLAGPWAWPVSAVWLPLLPLCMLSRVYFGAHWWGDTIAGACIGAAVALAYVNWFSAWLAG